MTAERDSYRRILAATAIMGGATVVTILVGVIRTKLFALLVGPAGIGLIGLLTSIMATAAAVGIPISPAQVATTRSLLAPFPKWAL